MAIRITKRRKYKRTRRNVHANSIIRQLNRNREKNLAGRICRGSPRHSPKISIVRSPESCSWRMWVSSSERFANLGYCCCNRCDCCGSPIIGPLVRFCFCPAVSSAPGFSRRSARFESEPRSWPGQGSIFPWPRPLAPETKTADQAASVCNYVASRCVLVNAAPPPRPPLSSSFAGFVAHRQ